MKAQNIVRVWNSTVGAAVSDFAFKVLGAIMPEWAGSPLTVRTQELILRTISMRKGAVNTALAFEMYGNLHADRIPYSQVMKTIRNNYMSEDATLRTICNENGMMQAYVELDDAFRRFCLYIDRVAKEE